LQPFIRKTLFIIPALLGLGRESNAPFDLPIFNYYESPRLLVGAAGRGGGRCDGILDQVKRNRLGGEGAHSPPCPDPRQEGIGTRVLLKWS